MNEPTKDNGGPAFPYWNGIENTVQGMTLRDWFAGMALQGLCNGSRGSGYRKSELAKDAYSFADSMIAARKEGA